MSLISEECSIKEIRNLVEAKCLYAIVDSSASFGIASTVLKLRGERAITLFQGSPLQNYLDVAPYVLEVDRPALRWMLEDLWSDPWGILVATDQGLHATFVHLRKMISALARGTIWTFRYYDPRVLPQYLASCRDAEQRDFFDTVRGFGIVNEVGNVSWIRLAQSLPVIELISSSASRPIRVRFTVRSDSIVYDAPPPFLVREEQVRKLAALELSAFPETLASDSRDERVSLAPQAQAFLQARKYARAFVDPNCATHSFVNKHNSGG